MKLEIERKFLIKKEFISKLSKIKPIQIAQGYLTLEKGYHTRVRLSKKGRSKTATITSKVGSGLVRQEYEQNLEVSHCEMLFKHCKKILRKERRKIKFGGFIWEVDFFPDHNIWVAEIEVPSKNTKFTLPEFAGKEVTHDHKYSNIRLAKKVKKS
jgi:adenylate cyclase